MEARNLGMPKELRQSRICARYVIKWIAEPAENSEKIMALAYKDRKPRRWRVQDLSLAYLMKNRFPSITKDVLMGKAKDIRIVRNGIIVLATPQRSYSEWAHDFLKTDLCVFGPVSKEAEIVERFEELKKASIAEKARAKEYVRHASPYLDSLVLDGLVIGVLGRGSYFDKNGFPDVVSKHEDINFVLFSRDSGKRTKNKIVGILKKISEFGVTLIEHKEKRIKSGKHPYFNFTIVSEDMASHTRAGKYERYVLQHGTSVGLPHLAKAKSEVLARKFLRLLSKT